MTFTQPLFVQNSYKTNELLFQNFQIKYINRINHVKSFSDALVYTDQKLQKEIRDLRAQVVLSKGSSVSSESFTASLDISRSLKALNSQLMSDKRQLLISRILISIIKCLINLLL